MLRFLGKKESQEGSLDLRNDWWLVKGTVASIHSEVLLGSKKRWVMSFAAMWIDLESFPLSEHNQKEMDTHNMIIFICGYKET